MPPKKHLTYITNCQGPVLIRQFLLPGSQQFADSYELVVTPQIQQVQDHHIEGICQAFDRSDVILAQPFPNTPFEELTVEALRHLAQVRGKQLIFFSSLHLPAFFPTHIPGGYTEPFPFEYNEDIVLLNLYLKGVTPKTAVDLYHKMDLFSEDFLLSGIHQNIQDFRHRETTFETDIKVAEFYKQTWQKERLHYIRAHPTAPVFRFIAEDVYRRLGFDITNPDAFGASLGASWISMPIMGSLKDGFGLQFSDDPFTARINNEDVPFEGLVANIFDFYREKETAFLTKKARTANKDIFERIQHG